VSDYEQRLKPLNLKGLEIKVVRLLRENLMLAQLLEEPLLPKWQTLKLYYALFCLGICKGQKPKSKEPDSGVRGWK